MTAASMPQCFDPTSRLLPSSVIAALIALVVVGFVVSEVRFYFRYHRLLVPNANKIPPGPTAPYRDYAGASDRAALLLRILDRLLEHARAEEVELDDDGDDGAGRRRRRGRREESEVAYAFIESWFRRRRGGTDDDDDDDGDAPYELFSGRLDAATLGVGLCPPPPPVIRMALSSSSPSPSSSDVGTTTTGGSGGAGGRRIRRGNMDEFLSWAFFGVSHPSLLASGEARAALDGLHDALRERAGLSFEPGADPDYEPLAFTLERVNSLYRPLCVYAATAFVRGAGCCLLRAMGFRKLACGRGLGYWHRSPDDGGDDAGVGRPFLFFHGIAPGGHAPYLPMIFLGLLRGPRLSYRRRHVFLFENDPISYAMSSDALSEEDTVHGVLEAMDRHLGDEDGDASGAKTARSRDLDVCGHSFGTCQLTWLIKCPRIGDRIGSMFLLDPVSILLSEPDVVTNFLYGSRLLRDPSEGCKGWTVRLVRCFHRMKIRLAVSSEIFIESYLRRNFAWYGYIVASSAVAPCQLLPCILALLMFPLF